jgi:hypothetical protein
VSVSSDFQALYANRTGGGKEALHTKFGDEASRPASVPNYPLALRRVALVIEEVTGNLEAGVLEDLALEIARGLTKTTESPNQASPQRMSALDRASTCSKSTCYRDFYAARLRSL